jgi:two-component system CheB/CheR fusion protein
MESVNEELRIQAEQATSYRLYLESVLRSMNGGIIVVDESRIVQSWNRWSENTWGLRSEEVLGAHLDSLDFGLPIHLLRDEMSAVQSGHQEQVERVLDCIDRRGRSILCRVRLTGLYDELEASRGLVLVMQDITEERRQEDYTRYLGRVLGRALNEIYFLDPATLRFQLANEGAKKKLGYAEQQLMQMSLGDVIPGASLASLKALFAPLFAGEKAEMVLETTIRAANGGEHPVELCMQYFADETPPILMATVHVTSERQTLAGGG